MTILGKTEPRIYTPPKRELIGCACPPGTCYTLTEHEVDGEIVPGHRFGCGVGRTTDGYACIQFAERLMGLTLFPWQEWLLLHALELNENGGYRFRYIIVLVARQNGKSLVLLLLALWHLFALGSPEVIATAQDLGRSEAAWKEAVEWVEEDDELSELIVNVDRGHPKLMEVGGDNDEEMPWKRLYRVASAGRRGARGFSGDLVLMDELREHQTWDTWGAVTNTMNARPSGQAWAFSNAGDNLSIVLRYLRARIHKMLGWPDGDADKEVLGEDDPVLEEFLAQYGADEKTGLFEWSAPPKSSRIDIEALAQANPSMNYTHIVPQCVTEGALIASLATTPPGVFDTEVRCIWVPMLGSGPFPEGSWEATLDDTQKPAENSAQVVCVAVSKNRSKGYIARAGWTEDGKPVVGIAAERAGTDWIIPWLIENRATYEHVVAQDKGAPVDSLWHELESARDATEGCLLPLKAWTATDVAPATGIMFDRLQKSLERDEDGQRHPHIYHLSHPGLDDAALSAIPKVLSRSAFEIDTVKSPTDVQPLQAAIGALWALEAVPPEIEPQIYDWPDDEEISAWLKEANSEDWSL